MFRDCGNNNLKRVACYLKAKKGNGNTKADFDFAALGEGGYLDKWMDGTNPSTTPKGAFYCHPEMQAYWVHFWDADWYGNDSKNQFANRPKNWNDRIFVWEDYIQP